MKSYTAEFKLKVVEFAEKINEQGERNGSEKAAEKFDVPNGRTVRKWVQSKDKLKVIPRSIRKKNPRRPHHLFLTSD